MDVCVTVIVPWHIFAKFLLVCPFSSPTLYSIVSLCHQSPTRACTAGSLAPRLSLGSPPGSLIPQLHVTARAGGLQIAVIPDLSVLRKHTHTHLEIFWNRLNEPTHLVSVLSCKDVEILSLLAARLIDY